MEQVMELPESKARKSGIRKLEHLALLLHEILHRTGELEEQAKTEVTYRKSIGQLARKG